MTTDSRFGLLSQGISLGARQPVFESHKPCLTLLFTGVLGFGVFEFRPCFVYALNRLASLDPFNDGSVERLWVLRTLRFSGRRWWRPIATDRSYQESCWIFGVAVRQPRQLPSNTRCRVVGQQRTDGFFRHADLSEALGEVRLGRGGAIPPYQPPCVCCCFINTTTGGVFEFAKLTMTAGAF